MTVHDTQEERPDENTDQPDNMMDTSAEQKIASVTNLRPTVGDELRIRREEAGQTIQDVSETVRIQRRYLEALEDGRLEDLPGTVYALGFLRTYAEYSGFSGDEFVTRFKEETEGQRSEQDFSLPEPIEDARVPTAAIVIVAIVLAVGAYVAWYGLRPQEAEVTVAVPEVPAHLATVAEETAPAPDPAMPAPAPQPVIIAPSPQPVVTAPVEPKTVPSAGNVASPGEPAIADAPTVVTETEVPPAPEIPPVTEETVEIPVAPAEPATPVAEAPPAAAEAAAVTPPVALATDTPSAPAVEEVPYVPQIFGVGATDSRIVITAAEDSWVEVTDAEGNRLLSRTMRAGDSYRVPNREGLVFVTGNAGGLKITVDGVPAPAIGDIGIVRKNVKLDAELLKQGRAWP